jgi:hypothetical protein
LIAELTEVQMQRWKKKERDTKNTINSGLSTGTICNLINQVSWANHVSCEKVEQAVASVYVWELRCNPDGRANKCTASVADCSIPIGLTCLMTRHLKESETNTTYQKTCGLSRLVLKGRIVQRHQSRICSQTIHIGC